MIWDYQYQNINYIKQYFKNIYFVPPAFSIIYNKYYDNTNNNKTIDVLMYGTKNYRRSNIMCKLKEKNINTLFKTFHHLSSQNEMISKTRIVLIINFYESNKPIDFYRISYLLSNKIFIIHEFMQKDDENINFMNNIVCCPYNEIVDRCIYYLKKSQIELDNLAQKSYEFFKENYNTKNFINDEIKNILVDHIN